MWEKGALLRNSFFLMVVLIYLAIAVIPVSAAGNADIIAFKECVIEKLIEILEIGVIIYIISLVVEHGIEELAKRAGEELLKKLAKALGKKLIPWIGAALIVIELVRLFWDCLPLLA